MWRYTAVVLVAGLRYAFAEATPEGLWLQVSVLLLELGVLSGARQLLVLGDGATWILTWYEGVGISSKAMILCWWHLRKRCYEQINSAGGPKDRRRALGKELLGELWEGKVNAAIAPGVIDALEAIQPIGTAYPAGLGKHRRGPAKTFRRVVNKEELAACWNCAGRKFIELGEAVGHQERWPVSLGRR